MKLNLKAAFSVIAITATLSLSIGFTQTWDKGQIQINFSTSDLNFIK